MKRSNFVSFAATNFFRESYAVFVLVHGMILNGANAGFSSFLIPRLKQESNNLSVTEESFLGALPNITTTICILPAMLFVIKFGRLKNLRIVFAMDAIGWSLMAVSPNIACIFISTIIISVGSALLPTIVATYLVETSRITRRGVYLSFEFFFGPVGVSLDLILNNFLPWKMVAVVMAAISVSALIQSFVIPETKYWYILKRKPHLAESSLLWFEPNLPAEEVQRQIEGMQRSIASDANNRPTLVDFLKSFAQVDYAKPMFLGMILFVLRGLSGRSVLSSYCVDVFGRLNTPYDSDILCFWFGWLQNIANLYYLVLTYRYGRKTTFYNIVCVMIVCLVPLGILSVYRGDDKNSIPFAPVAFAFVYFSSACTGYISSIGVIVAEMQPARFRAEVMTGCLLMFMLACFFANFTYPIFVRMVDFYVYFGSFFVVAVISFTIVYVFVPETSKKEFYDSQVYDTRL